MSNARVDISPAIHSRQRDISSWGEADISRLNSKGKKRYYKLKFAIKDYFTTEDSIGEIALRHHISSQMLLKQVSRCLMQHQDGTPWGYRALLTGVTVIDHSQPSISTEETPEEVIDPSPCESDQPSLDEKFIEDDEDTTKRHAIKISPADEPIEEIAPASLMDEDKLEAFVDEEPRTPLADNKEEDAAIDAETTSPAESLDLSADPVATDPTDEVPPRHSKGGSGVEWSGDPLVSLASEIAETVSTDVPAEIVGINEEKIEASGEGTAIEATEDASIAGRARRQVIVRDNLLPAVLPLYSKRQKRVDIKKIAQTRRSIRKRWVRDVQNKRKQKRFHRIATTAVLSAFLFLILMPLGTGLAAYSAYNTIRNVALDGVNHLLAVKSLLPVSKSDPLAALDTGKLKQAQRELSKAESDFLQLQQLVNRPDMQSAIEQFAPQYSGKLGMAQRLVQVGIDVSRMGNEVIGVALLGANLFHSSPLANGSTKPLITTTDVFNAEGVMIHALYYIDDIRTQMSQVSLKELPISDKQQKELTSVLALLPKAQDMIVQGQGLIGIVAWLLGVGQARHFLVQTMDRAELRPGGGFTGMYGILTIQDGRMAPFSLQDVTELDYNGNGVELGRQAPPEYRSWMKFGFWGLRDSNLSGDYPTTARIGMQVFQEEGGGPVDGDIALTPTVIAHVLNVIGPVKVPQYNETITAQNLEDKLHYYQQDFGAISLERQKTGTHNASTRKAFTSLLGKLLLEKVRHLQVNQLLKIVQNAVKDIQSRDLEIYFANPLAETWLVQHGYSGAMDTFAKQDGFMVVQSNISISKASQYVHTTEQDNITLDAQGGAYHNLTITLDYKQTGPVYGYDTYADYIRVYAPANAQFLGGDGFDTGQCLTPAPKTTGGSGGTGGTGGTGSTCCTTGQPPTPPTPGNGKPPKPTGTVSNPCAQYAHSFPSSARYCPSGNYSLGQRGYDFSGKGYFYWPVDRLGSPTELSSDLPGRAMWGGLTLTPKNCISTITLQWYVPHEVKNIPGQSPYSILVQKQGGYIPTVQITIDTSAIKGLKPFSFQGNLIADRLFFLPPRGK